MTHNKNTHDTPEDILKKIEEESSEQKKQAAYKILQGDNKPKFEFSWWNIFKNKLNANVQARKKEFVKQVRLSENKHLFIVTFFFIGAVWVSWKIE
jgi:hypothetical protein